MKQDTLLIQCILQKADNNQIETVVWIEAEKAKLGKQVLTSDVYDKTKTKNWWNIIQVGSNKVEYGKLSDRTSIWDVEINKIRGNK